MSSALFCYPLQSLCISHHWRWNCSWPYDYNRTKLRD